MSENEHIIMQNSLGIITNKKLVLKYKNGNEEIPISKITSVSYVHKRGYIFGIGNFILTAIIWGSVIIRINDFDGIYILIMILISFLTLLTGIANWIGNYNIEISVNGNNRKPLSVSFSKTKEGLNLVNVIKKEISN